MVAQRDFIERLHELAAALTKHDDFFIAAIDRSFSEKP
jgi:hypothetical protein